MKFSHKDFVPFLHKDCLLTYRNEFGATVSKLVYVIDVYDRTRAIAFKEKGLIGFVDIEDVINVQRTMTAQDDVTQAFMVWWFSSPKHISWSFDSVDTSTYFQSYSIPLTEQDKLILKSSLNCMKFNDAGWDEARINLSKRLSKLLLI